MGDMINRRNKDDIDLKDEEKEEKKDEFSDDDDEEGKEHDDEDDDEMLYVPFEEGLFLLIDENFFVIDCNDPNQRSVRIMDFFDGGNSEKSIQKWEEYMQGNKATGDAEAWSLEFIVSTEQIDETDIDENGNE